MSLAKSYDGLECFPMFWGKLINRRVEFAVIDVIIPCHQSLIIHYSKLKDHGRLVFMPKEIKVFIIACRLSMVLSAMLINSLPNERVGRRVQK